MRDGRRGASPDHMTPEPAIRLPSAILGDPVAEPAAHADPDALAAAATPHPTGTASRRPPHAAAAARAS